ncbi:MAG: hypothetical protein ACJA0F_002428 [Dinoroseobacter sp.]|jgi:hypothetical protein
MMVICITAVCTHLSLVFGMNMAISEPFALLKLGAVGPQ